MFKIPIKEGTERCFTKQNVQEDEEEKDGNEIQG